MKRAEEFIKTGQALLQESPLRKQENSIFVEASRARSLAQMEGEWVELADKCRQPLHVVMMGQVKSGKSTLLNALIGREVSPVNVTEATACIMEFSYATADSAEIVRKDGGAMRGVPAEIFDILTKNQNDQHFFNDCEVVKIQMPLPKLKDFYLVDTPGLATMTEQNAERTQSYFQKADVVLWVLNGNYLGNSDVNNELRKVAKMGKPIIAIVNRIDEYEEDVQECLEYAQQELGIYVKYLLPLSAKNAFQAIQSGDSTALEQSGFTALLEYLENKIERQADEVHDASLLNSAKALLGRELLLHRECLAEIEGKLLIINAHQDRVLIKSQMIRDAQRDKVQAWFSHEFLTEKELRLNQKIESMSLFDSAFGSGAQDIPRVIDELFSEREVRREIETFLAELERSMQEDWQGHLKAVQQEVAMDFVNFQQKYLMEAKAIEQSLPSAGKSAMSGIGEGVAVAGVAGAALASYSALLGPMSAYVSMGSALSATLPPLLLAGAAAGALIGVFNFKKEKSNYHRVVSEIVGKIRDSAKATAMPEILKRIDSASRNVSEGVQAQVTAAEFGGLKTEDVARIQTELNAYHAKVEKARNIE